MNRGQSSDSLANSDAGIICSSSGSSSPTDFTSDDETNADNLYMMSGQPMDKSRSRNTGNSAQAAKIDKYPSSHHYRNDYPLIQPRTILSSNQHHISNRLNFKDECPVDPSALNPSTSYYDNSPPAALSSRHLNTSDVLSPRGISDVTPSPSSIALMPDQPFRNRCNNRIERSTRPSDRYLSSIIRSMQRGVKPDGSMADDDGENQAEDEVLNEMFESGEVNEMYARNNVSLERSVLPSISNSNRGINTIAVRMCARLVECRSLFECFEFIEENRELIEDVTRIITQEAPAYRNYDINNYQIDYSVKESFNPNFWHDREPIVTTADGNCQYHAVSLGLTGTEAYTPEVRLATAVAVVDNREWFDSMLKLIDRGSVLDLVRTIARSYSWGDETTLKAIAVAINKRIFLYTCNIGKKDYEMVKSLSKDELLDAFKEKKYRGGTGIHTYADPLIHVPANNYIMLFHKSEHFIAVLPTTEQPTMFEPYNPIVPVFE